MPSNLFTAFLQHHPPNFELIHTLSSPSSSVRYLSVVEYLLQNGADPNIVDEDGNSPLYRAVVESHLNVVS